MKKLLMNVCMSVFATSLFMLAAPVGALQLSGYVHSDWGFESMKESMGRPYVDFQVRYNLADRKELESGVFVEVFSQVQAKSTGVAGVRDAWVKLGNKKFDLKVGRFEKTQIVQRGEEIYFAPVESAVENIRYRQLCDAMIGRPASQGDLALTYYVSEAMKIEIGAVWFPSVFKSISDTPAKDMGVRPVVQYQNESFMIIVGGEYRHRASQDTSLDESKRDTMDVGGTFEKRFGKFKIALAGGARNDKTYGADGNRIGKIDSSTISGYMTIPFSKADKLGLYGAYTMQKFMPDGAETENRALTTVNVAYIHPAFLSIQGTELGFGAGYTKAGKDENERGFGGIVRFTYRF